MPDWLRFLSGQNDSLGIQQNPGGIVHLDFTTAFEKLFSNNFVGKIKK
jgi:hypothetical protein